MMTKLFCIVNDSFSLLMVRHKVHLVTFNVVLIVSKGRKDINSKYSCILIPSTVYLHYIEMVNTLTSLTKRWFLPLKNNEFFYNNIRIFLFKKLLK